MEVPRISTRFPTTPFEFGHRLPRNLVLRNPRKSPFSHCPIAVDKLSSDTGAMELKPRNRMLILGMGYVGQFFAQELKNQGWAVSGTCTSIMKKEELEEKGFDDIYLFDANELEPSTLNTLKYYTHLLVSIPPPVGIGDPMLRHGELFSKLKDGNLQWLCYLSSTSVYGNCGGNWVDEEYPASPTSELARLRLAAEEGWLNLGHDLGLSVQVFRLGGIYGPGRSAIDTILKQGPVSEGQKRRASRQYTSRVHVADICQALKAAIYTPSSGKIYNIVDDDPTPREEVFALARNLVEKKWPGCIKPDASFHEPESSAQIGRSESEKRVSNARMKKELGVTLLYPNYRSGLRSIIDHLENPFLNGA